MPVSDDVAAFRWVPARLQVSNTKHARILWNRSGVFVQTDMTELSLPSAFPNTGGDTHSERTDVNQDGLQDLVAIGNQNPLHGW